MFLTHVVLVSELRLIRKGLRLWKAVTSLQWGRQKIWLDALDERRRRQVRQMLMTVVEMGVEILVESSR